MEFFHRIRAQGPQCFDSKPQASQLRAGSRAQCFDATSLRNVAASVRGSRLSLVHSMRHILLINIVCGNPKRGVV